MFKFLLHTFLVKKSMYKKIEGNMQITEIAKVGKGLRYRLFIDENFEGVFEAEVLARYNLKTGQEIDEDFLQALKIENGDLACFDRSLGLLEHGMKSQKQVVDYLKGKGYPIACIDKAIAKLSEYGYINDLAYACEYVKLYSQKDGKKKIEYALKSKGVDDEVITEAFERNLTQDLQDETCLKLAQKKAKNLELDAKGKQKLFSYLAGRGFDFETIKRAVNTLEKE